MDPGQRRYWPRSGPRPRHLPRGRGFAPRKRQSHGAPARGRASRHEDDVAPGASLAEIMHHFKPEGQTSASFTGAIPPFRVRSHDYQWVQRFIRALQAADNVEGFRLGPHDRRDQVRFRLPFGMHRQLGLHLTVHLHHRRAKGLPERHGIHSQQTRPLSNCYGDQDSVTGRFPGGLHSIVASATAFHLTEDDFGGGADTAHAPVYSLGAGEGTVKHVVVRRFSGRPPQRSRPQSRSGSAQSLKLHIELPLADFTGEPSGRLVVSLGSGPVPALRSHSRNTRTTRSYWSIRAPRMPNKAPHLPQWYQSESGSSPVVI